LVSAAYRHRVRGREPAAVNVTEEMGGPPRPRSARRPLVAAADFDHLPRAPQEVPARITAEERSDRFEAALRRHSEEAVDPSWATRSKASLEKVLGAVAEVKSFSLVRIDCRSTTCVGTFDWPSYQDAVDQSGALLHSRFRPNCYREIVLPEPANKAAKYRGNFLVDCGKGGEFPLPD